jgi:hypothetical protein
MAHLPCGINARFQVRLNVNRIFTPLQFLRADCKHSKNKSFNPSAGITGIYVFGGGHPPPATRWVPGNRHPYRDPRQRGTIPYGGAAC